MPTVPFSTSSDSSQLVAAPGKGQFIRVIGGDFSSSAAASTVSLKSGSTVIWESAALAGSSGGRIALNVDKERTIDCAPGTALNLGTSSTTITGSVEYVVMGTPLIGNNTIPGFG